MAAIVCQGLQSCLESQVLEPRALRLRLSSPRPHFSQPLELAIKSCFFDSNTKQVDEEKCHTDENTQLSDSVDDKEKNISSNADSDSWSFLEAISSGSKLSSKSETTDKESAYVHPLVKRSMSSLSEKSLELCTENLGSETGTDIIEDSIFSLSSSSSSSSSEDCYSHGGNSPTREQQKSRQLLGAKKASSRSFPPPLTTISGLESLQVRPHREDGRLIMKAIKAPSTHSLFQAERSHGRLRLCLFKDSPSFFDSEEAQEVAVDEIRDHNEDYEEEDTENDANCGEKEGMEEEEEDLEEHDDGENYACTVRDMNGNKKDAGGEMGMKKFKRPGRCKEGETTEKKGLLNWEAFSWVATS
ncbi:protein FANTASTIC FOUR 3-like [Melia azedarach]|uniref:Protein FANTASTIC FOUR 3-like n=1 Tax=Melia azedarach TaxID=155640 RepID=A0ACC1YGP6_MELAZ|nr:protein FANTASTIC FOUR 3-like [Melia azedarach]